MLPLLAAALLQTADPDVAVRIAPSLDPSYSGGWQAFAAELHNPSAREREIEIRVADALSGQRSSRVERLGPGARKRVFLHLHRAFPTQAGLESEILESGRPLRRARLFLPAPGAWEASHSALLTGSRATPADFRLPDRALRRIEPESFPDRWFALQSLEAIILHDLPWEVFSPERLKALHDFVRMGGRLVLSPGPQSGWLDHPALRDLVRIEVEGLEEVDPPTDLEEEFRRFTVKTRKHRIAGGAPLSSRGERWIRVHRVGAGGVVVLPFDVRRPPFDEWAGLGDLRDVALGSPLPRYDPDFRYAPSIEGMQAAIDGSPSKASLALLISILVLVMGSAQAWFVRRHRAPLLTVAATPLLAGLLLAIVLAGGYLLNGISTVVHSSRFIPLKSVDRWATAAHLALLYSPSQRTYDLALSPGQALLPLKEDRRHSDLEVLPTSIRNGSGLILTGVPTAQWQARLLMSANPHPMPAGSRFRPAEGTCSPLGRVAQGGPHPYTPGAPVKHVAQGPLEQIQAALQSTRILRLDVVGDAAAAKAVMESLPKVREARLEGTTLRFGFAGTREEVPDLVRALVERGVGVAGLSEEKADLEGLFMRLTEGEVA
jgi:hypothetical protein